MMLRFSLEPARGGRPHRVRGAGTCWQQGLRTADIWSEGTRKVGTREMGDAVVAAITENHYQELAALGSSRPHSCPANEPGSKGFDHTERGE